MQYSFDIIQPKQLDVYHINIEMSFISDEFSEILVD